MDTDSEFSPACTMLELSPVGEQHLGVYITPATWGVPNASEPGTK